MNFVAFEQQSFKTTYQERVIQIKSAFFKSEKRRKFDLFRLGL